MAITAKELAKKLNLSEAAVSLALNNKPGVSTKTRKRVLEAAREFHYDFSRIRSAEPPAPLSGSIYLIIYHRNGAIVTDTPFFSQVFEGIDLECKRDNYFLNFLYVYENDDIPRQLRALKDAGTRGIVLLGTEMRPQDLQPFLHCEIPFVLLDNYFENFELDSVLINNVQGAFNATNYLIQKRHVQPGDLHSSYPISNFEERADGFYKALRENGMPTSRSLVHRLSPSIEGAYADMRHLLLQEEPLANCYFADNDLIAIGAMRAFQEFGYRIPQDIAIIGFDNVPLCAGLVPALSSIHVPKEYMGKMAVQRLHERITYQMTEHVKIEIATTLIARKST